MCAGTGPDQELARQQFGELRGVELLVPYLDLDPNNQTSQNLLYVIVDCVWNAIVGMPTNEQRFLELKVSCDSPMGPRATKRAGALRVGREGGVVGPQCKDLRIRSPREIRAFCQHN